MRIDVKKCLFHLRYVVVILVLGTALSLATPAFLSFTNLTNVMWSVSVIGIISVGATFAMLVGKIDLSVGRVSAMAGIVATTAILDWNLHHLPAICLGIACAALLGCVNGYIVAFTKVPDFVATFAMSSVVLGLAQVATKGTTLSIMEPKSYTFLGTGKVLSVPMPVVIFLASTLIGLFLLNKTVFGRKCYCVGGNPLASRLSGISVRRTVVLAYALTGAMAGVGGIVHNALSQQAGPHMGGGFELDVIAAIVIGGASMTGGVGAISGTFFGTILTGLINNGLNLLNIPGTWHPIVKGFIIIGAVAFNGFSADLERKRAKRAAA